MGSTNVVKLSEIDRGTEACSDLDDAGVDVVVATLAAQDLRSGRVRRLGEPFDAVQFVLYECVRPAAEQQRPLDVGQVGARSDQLADELVGREGHPWIGRQVICPVDRLVAQRHLEHTVGNVLAKQFDRRDGLVVPVTEGDVMQHRQSQDQVEVAVHDQIAQRRQVGLDELDGQVWMRVVDRARHSDVDRQVVDTDHEMTAIGEQEREVALRAAEIEHPQRSFEGTRQRIGERDDGVGAG